MAEVVVGTGRKNSIREILGVLDAQLRANQGVPRKILARTDTTEVVAERPDFERDFETCIIRVRKNGKELDEFKAAANEGPCSLSEEDEFFVASCAANGEAGVDAYQAAVDKVSATIPLPEVWRVEGDNYRIDPVSVELLFRAMVKYKASDVHLAPGEPAVFRVDNETRTSDLVGILSSAQILALIKEIAPDRDWKEFVEDMQCSFNFHEVGIGYARVSAFMKSSAPHCTLRFLPEKIPSFDDLHIPSKTMIELGSLKHGLLLVTGMTGSGKTTTVAALVDWINTHRAYHILCIENPVEYVHKNEKSVISQRNLGPDVHSFDDAVSGALRHDPDVIVIGEMRDPDTIRSAINAAATGHLVISTLHSNTASEVVNRIVSFFDPVERDLVRLQLRDCLKCVICQRLVPKKGGGRVPALEFMFNDIKCISDGVIAGDTDAIRIGMQQTVSHSFLFEQYLLRLVKEGSIDVQHAQEYSTEQSIFDQLHMGTYSVPRVESLKAARDASQRS